MYSPAEIADRVLEWGVSKCKLSVLKMIVLGILAGMFIALAGIASTFANVYVGRFAGACVFPCGLSLTVVCGSELFTGNNLIFISVLDRKVRLRAMLRNWIVVYIGNFIGGMIISLVSVYGGVFSNPDVAAALVSTAVGKANMTFYSAVLKGIICNILVCGAVWMSFATKTAEGKIILMFFPVMAFVICGSEHCVANMFYLPSGFLTAAKYGIDAAELTVGRMLFNALIPSTVGNIIGGCGVVSLSYWYIYHKDMIFMEHPVKLNNMSLIQKKGSLTK